MMNYAVWSLLIAVSAACAPAFGGQRSSEKSVKWQVPYRTFAVQGDEVSVNLHGAAHAASWRFAAVVKPRGDGKTRVQAAELHLESGLGRPLTLAGIRAYAEREVSVAGARVDVWLRPSAPDLRSIVYLDLPKPMTVALSMDGSRTAQLAVTDSAYFVDGSLVPEKIASLAGLLVRSLSPPGTP